MCSGKAEATKNFVKEYPADEIQQIVVDEHLTTKQMHNLENLEKLPVKERERLIWIYFLRELLQQNQKLQIQLAKIKYQFPQVRENFRDKFR